MCGFTGFIGEVTNSEKVLEDMMNQIIHRGPDNGGKFTDGKTALGFRRLSIIDLEQGNQPLYNEDRSLVLVFNGEIYNFKALKENLIKKGHLFKTSTDSEVLIHGYEEYGEELVQKLRGMFAFVIWDRSKNKLFAARDQFGVKPFYYAYMNSTLMVSSEIKSFLPHPKFIKSLNEQALKPYLTFQFPVLNETFFKGVFKLPAAHYMTFENGKIEVVRYWEPSFNEEESPLLSIVEEIDEVVRDSINTHKISDVKVGSFLSSGVDSSYVASVLKPDKTFSVGFNAESFSEIDNAVELSKELNIDNINEILNTDVCFEKLEEIQYMMDEPHSNPSIVPLYFLSELARKHVTVVLSGEGADELFGGYEEYYESPTLRKYKKLPNFVRKPVARVASQLPEVRGKRFFMKGGLPVEETFIGQARIFEEVEAVKILQKNYHHGPSVKEIVSPIYQKNTDKDEITKKQLLDLNLWLVDDILLKADKMSMAHSIELRVPFLDKEVMKVASKIPSRYRVNSVDTKYAFRLAAKKSVPTQWANRKKIGFPVPIKLWLKEEEYYLKIKSVFENDFVDTFFNKDEILKLLTNHFEGRANNQRKIWTIYMFLLWYRRYFSN